MGVDELEHERWMRRALEIAAESRELGEVPVGAVVVSAGNEELGYGANQPISTHDPTAHAEIVALRDAGRRGGNYRLPGARLYVTIEPCTMCFGALIHARISTLIFGTREPKAGALLSHPIGDLEARYNHRLDVVEGVLQAECRALMQDFFAQRRKK